MGKKVLITGGNGDIAQAIKELLIFTGYEVYAPTRKEMDVTDIEKIEKTMQSFLPDILINNAGYVVPQSIRNANIDSIKTHIDVNLSGVFYCTALGLKYNPNLEVINIGSAAAVEVHGTWSEYCATKSGVLMATQCWADDGIYCVCISPGRTKTKMRKSLYPNEDQSTLLDPADLAKVVLKAVEHGYTTGTHLIVRKQNVEDILEGKTLGRKEY